MRMNTEERLRRMERLLAVARSLSAAPEHETFLQLLISAASELTDSEAASVLEQDSNNRLRFVAAPWFHRDALQSIQVPLEGSAAGWVYQQKKPLILQDAQADSRHNKEADRAANFITRSLLGVPILYRGQTIGVCEVLNKRNDMPYTDEDIAILETLASLAGAAIANAALQRRVQATYDEMARLEQMKNDFIAITSHELRTPLGLILGHATFLRELADKRYKEQLDTIIRNATKLKEIVENLSNVDNVQSGAARLRRKTFSMTQVLTDVAASYLPEAREKGLDFRLSVEDDELRIEGDAEKITIALSNLIKNAIHYTNPGGHVVVVAERIPDYVKVSVIDDGIGIPAKDLPHIFDRFYQVESHLTRRHGGMGLGLSAAKAMVEMHSGRIWAESVEGKGSIFTFILPLEAPPEQGKTKVFTG